MQQSDSGPRPASRTDSGAEAEAEVASPCVSVCRINPDTELCEGCLRTIDEVAEWATMSNAERRAVLQAIEVRTQALFDGPSG